MNASLHESKMEREDIWFVFIIFRVFSPFNGKDNRELRQEFVGSRERGEKDRQKTLSRESNLGHLEHNVLCVNALTTRLLMLTQECF